MIDTEGYKKINSWAQRTKLRVDIGEWKEATQYWGYTQSVVLRETCNVDFYNILTKRECSEFYHLLTENVQSIDEGTHSHAQYHIIR